MQVLHCKMNAVSRPENCYKLLIVSARDWQGRTKAVSVLKLRLNLLDACIRTNMQPFTHSALRVGRHFPASSRIARRFYERPLADCTVQWPQPDPENCYSGVSGLLGLQV